MAVQLLIFSGCVTTLPPEVQSRQTIKIQGIDFAAVKGLMPIRYTERREALLAACQKYMNLPGAHVSISKNRDLITFREFWIHAVEYCGALVKLNFHTFANSNIVLDSTQGFRHVKNCVLPDFVLSEGQAGYMYNRDTLEHNHPGSGPFTLGFSGDCGALEVALAVDPQSTPLSLVAFIGEQGQGTIDQIECAGWWELTATYSSDYRGQTAPLRYYNVRTDRYEPTMEKTIDLSTCEEKR